MENPLAKLKIDYWYKAVLVIATSVLIISLTVELKSVENNIVQLLSLGGIFCGLGEWINHPLQVKVGPNFKISGYPRKHRLGGYLFDLAGIVFIVIGLIKLLG